MDLSLKLGIEDKDRCGRHHWIPESMCYAITTYSLESTVEKGLTSRVPLVALFWTNLESWGWRSPIGEWGMQVEEEEVEEEADTPLTERPQFNMDFTQWGEDKPMWWCILSDKPSDETHEKAGG